MRAIEPRKAWKMVLLASLLCTFYVLLEPSVGYLNLKKACMFDGGATGIKTEPVESIHFARAYSKELYDLAKGSGIQWIEFDDIGGLYRRYSTKDDQYQLIEDRTSRYSITHSSDQSFRSNWGRDMSVSTYEYRDNVSGNVIAKIKRYSLFRDQWVEAVLPLKNLDCSDVFPNEDRFDEGNMRNIFGYVNASIKNVGDGNGGQL